MEKTTLAFEIGTEELPAFDLHAATRQLPGLVSDALAAARIPFDGVEAYSSPRRLIAIVRGVPERTEAAVEQFRGPAARIAFDAEGNPTKAAAGFARGKGVDVASLERRDEGGVEYVYAVKHTSAADVAGLLPEVLEGVIAAISWPKSCRWGTTSEYFSRPVRWIVALLGDRVVPVRFAGIQAGNLTRGHRFLAPGPHEVPHADKLLDVVRSAFVVASEQEREAAIRAQVAQAEEKTGLVADLPAKTLAEVVNLSEYPTVMVGEFDEKFLAVPKEIIVDAMLVHQRYFPLFSADGSLANKFLITSNGNPEFEADIVDGNQRVVAARLYDAKFFYDEDLKIPLEAYVERLDEVVFQEKLGTTRAKTGRIVKLVEHLCDAAGMQGQQRADALRAAYLCKADLVTGAVVEFTSVQGIMGSYYARAAGETDVVADAIADHYRPRFSGDATPATLPGKAVAFADKLDTICGLFAVDQAPTGSSDPFALRRSALGIVAMLRGDDALDVELVPAIEAALAAYAEDGIAFDADTVRDKVTDFFITRTKVMEREAGVSSDALDAVLAAGVREPAELVDRVHALEDARRDAPEAFSDLATAYARANNLRDASLGTAYDAALLLPVERALCDAVARAEQRVEAALDADDYPAALGELASLRKPVDAFFDEVMVMDEDAALRDNRLRVLNRFVGVFSRVADFGSLAK